MRIVITGGCGFLGRRLALKLLAEGSALGPVDELVLFDNTPSALPLPDDRRLTVVTGDIGGRRRHRADAADLLRYPEGDRRALGQRLQPQRLRRRPRIAPADRRGAAGAAEPRRLDLRLLDDPRALGRAGGDLPGIAGYGH